MRVWGWLVGEERNIKWNKFTDWNGEKEHCLENVKLRTRDNKENGISFSFITDESPHSMSGSVEFKTLTGSCGVGELSGWGLYASAANMNKFVALIEQICYDATYTILLAGISDKQTTLKQVLLDRGWVSSKEFVNRRSGTRCHLMTKELG